MKEVIQKLLDSDISSYKIGKETGISNSIIQRLRNGERTIGNLTLDTAETLYKYAKGVLKVEEREKEIIMQHLSDLLPIMEETSDNETKNRIDEKIIELMNNLNLTWEDM
ncbi:hypothetical protein ACLIJT_00410 [Staphylococcus gallinarum]|uniref:hypothetical protein n=1 Tax=Staphylococcus gallinarum TaxID=1293 RepID=UPI003A8F4C6B